MDIDVDTVGRLGFINGLHERHIDSLQHIDSSQNRNPAQMIS